MRSVIAVVLVAAVACGSEAPPKPLPSEVTGVITTIGRDDRGAIRSFAVDTGEGPFQIQIDPRRDYGFDLEHLEEHRAGRLPVRVTLEQREGELFAVQILDA